MFKKLIILFVVISQTVYATEWKKIKIPGAVCGNGSPYYIFYNNNSEKKLMVEFMGGGACWDFESCFILPHTIILPIPELSSFSIFSDDKSSMNFLSGHSKLYFPYCTGDVHAGRHEASYGPLGSKVYHHGDINIKKTLEYLDSNNIIEFKKVEDLVVWGASAGAIATLVHAKKFEKLVASTAQKTMIVDSPGLHWGKNFWDKFSKEMVADFDAAFSELGVHHDFKDGFIAKDLKPAFKAYKNWKMGVMFADKDIIMSTIFGDISPDDQAELINGNDGFPALAKNFKNANVWVNNTLMHTFLLLSESAKMHSVENITAIDFAQTVYESKLR